jgi:hypothetical protein
MTKSLALRVSIVLCCWVQLAAPARAQDKPVESTDRPAAGESEGREREPEPEGHSDAEESPSMAATHAAEAGIDPLAFADEIAEPFAFRWSTTLVVLGLVGCAGTLGVEFYLGNKFVLLERLSECGPRYREASCPDAYAETKEGIQTVQTLGIVSLGVGGALFALGTALYFFETYTTTKTASSAPRGGSWSAGVSSQGLGMSWQNTW